MVQGGTDVASYGATSTEVVKVERKTRGLKVIVPLMLVAVAAGCMVAVLSLQENGPDELLDGNGFTGSERVDESSPYVAELVPSSGSSGSDSHTQLNDPNSGDSYQVESAEVQPAQQESAPQESERADARYSEA